MFKRSECGKRWPTPASDHQRFLALIHEKPPDGFAYELNEKSIEITAESAEMRVRKSDEESKIFGMQPLGSPYG